MWVDDNNGLNVLVNGIHVTNDTGGINDSAYVDITRSEANKITSSFYNGVFVTVTLSNDILNFVAALPRDFMGSTEGLLGNFNGNKTDDLRFPNKTLLDVGAADRMIHAFGQTCKGSVVKRISCHGFSIHNRGNRTFPEPIYLSKRTDSQQFLSS